MPRSDEHRDENVWFDDAAGPVVRPYAMTSGRTRATGEFDLIALVVAMRHTTVSDVGLGPEHLAILRLCQRPLSVAEIAAHLDLPIGIIRVLLSDLLDRELVFVRVPQPPADMPTDDIFKAVINGLRAL
ncbi:DUF742 domain-containing protein [Rugosimonospora acidiphila]|uniref:DUF742 domain-containing protein n=1 Tax=Rugosimonospora acidiphila TaxID=556531 RepID=A0ABP9RQT1_9ACTN